MKKKLLMLFGMAMLFHFGYAISCEKRVYYKTYGDESSYKNLDDSFGIDKNHIYYQGKIIKNIDFETFEIVLWNMELPHPVWGNTCQRSSYIKKFKDKNGEYTIEDISNGKLKLEE